MNCRLYAFALAPLLIMLGAGCSAEAGDGEIAPLGAAGTGSPGAGGGAGVTAGAFSTGGASAGAATVTVAGSGSGGVFSGTSGTGAGGMLGQAGSVAQAGSGSGGAAGTGTGGAGGTGVTPTDGKGLYDANCKVCHGEQGVGTLIAPETQHPVRDYSNWVVRNGRAQTTFPKPMEKFGADKLSDAQLTLIWNYLDQPPQPKTGKDLYGDYCANCHGADGKGGPTTRNIVNEVQNVLKMVRSGKSVGNYGMRHDSMPAFSTMRISDSELTLIHDYVDSF